MHKGKFAIIGCEHAHIEIFIGEMLDLGFECAGLYEPNNVKLAAEMAGKFNISLVREEASLWADDVTVIGSSAINNEKIDLIERCEAHGKHIMVDKPAVTSRSDLERLRNVVGRGKIQVGMLLTERFHAANYTLKQWIDGGRLGRLVSIGMRKPHRLRPEGRPSWFFSKEQCGGIVIDLLVHDFDLLRWFTGSEMEHTEGYMCKRIMPEHPDFYDVAGLQVLMKDGLAAQLYADWHTPEQSWTWGDGRIFVTGTEGFAELRLSGDPFVGKDSLALIVTNGKAVESVPLQHPPVSISADFMRRIEQGEAILTASDIIKATEDCITADEAVRIIRQVDGLA